MEPTNNQTQSAPRPARTIAADAEDRLNSAIHTAHEAIPEGSLSGADLFPSQEASNNAWAATAMFLTAARKDPANTAIFERFDARSSEQVAADVATIEVRHQAALARMRAGIEIWVPAAKVSDAAKAA